MSEPECHSGGKPEKRAHEHTEASSEIGEHGGRGHSDKRNEDADDEDVGWIGPTLSEAAPAKKKRVLAHEKLYLSNLPNADTYERSYMHRDVVTHCIVTKTDFVVTASIDGHIKFWKKQDVGIEFVKHFRAHLGNIQDLAANISGSLAVSISNDQHAKIFDVMNFDMINILKLDYVPFCCCWIHAASDAIALLAIAESSSPIIRVYDARGASSPLHSIDRMHLKPVLCMTYNAMLDVVISGDAGGIIEYWWGNKGGYQFPEKDVTFSAKLDTDLFDFVKHKTKPLSLCVSPDGKYFAASAEDGRIRVFRFHSGCLFFVIDESLSHYTALQSEKQPFPSMDFNKKVSYEKDLHKSESHRFSNLVFDQTGYYLLYSSMIGVKLVNLHTKKCVAVIGKSENLRCLHIALWQKALSAGGGLTSMEESVSDKFNEHLTNDPTLVCTAFRKSRFYMFTRRMAKDSSSSSDRDVFNEKPSQEERIAVSDDSKGGPRLFETAVLHTTVGDIFLKLFPSECPRTVENFCMHAKNSYYNGHIFHRVIKQFMIQTGDPTGIGTGGQSIWGGEFEDEFHPKLRHDRPYTVSMANAGPNTNGSQFFITVVPAPWLDNKHTVFGRVVRGMEVAQSISNAKTSSKTDKPYDDISILSVTVKDPFRV